MSVLTICVLSNQMRKTHTDASLAARFILFTRSKSFSQIYFSLSDMWCGVAYHFEISSPRILHMKRLLHILP